MEYVFPPKIGGWLQDKYDKLYIDSKDNIYDGNKALIQSY